MTDPIAAYLAELAEFYRRLGEIEEKEGNHDHEASND